MLAFIEGERESAPITSVGAAFWKYVKWLGGLQCSCKYNLLITYGCPWHLAKYFPCPLLSTRIKLWGTKGMHLILTQRLGTRLDRLTCRGANIWSCWRQDIAAAWTSESEWSCVIAHPTKQEERIVEIVAPLPNNVTQQNFSIATADFKPLRSKNYKSFNITKKSSQINKQLFWFSMQIRNTTECFSISFFSSVKQRAVQMKFWIDNLQSEVFWDYLPRSWS